jgi:NAD(P)-dependent dehydrogenase (short-subunit alcohol dehydrogenase family)
VDFTGKVAIVTGGASGIGAATARAFAAAGAKVVVVDREAAGAEVVAAELRDGGGEAIAVAADVSRSGDVAGYVAATLDRFGRIDCLFNNAGIVGMVAPVQDYDEDAFDAVLAVNLRGMFLGMRHALPVMLAQGSGSIVNMASTAALGGTANQVAYVASKHGVLGLTRAASADVARYGVRVNAVCPGATDTPFLRAVQETVDPGQAEAAAARYRAAIPTGRFVEAGEVADVVLFLCSDRARSITGAHFVIDGGRTAAPGGATSMKSS